MDEKRKIVECIHVAEILCYADITCTPSCSFHPDNYNQMKLYYHKVRSSEQSVKEVAE